MAPKMISNAPANWGTTTVSTELDRSCTRPAEMATGDGGRKHDGRAPRKGPAVINFGATDSKGDGEAHPAGYNGKPIPFQEFQS